MDMPPSRYKVVEKGRRLVVIDRLTGEAVRHQMPSAPMRMAEPQRAEMRRPEPIARGKPIGTGRVFTTSNWYDDKAPRRLELSDDKATALFFVGGGIAFIVVTAIFFFGYFSLVVFGFIGAQKATRTALRRGATSWLDMLPAA